MSEVAATTTAGSWPAEQSIERWVEQSVVLTTFRDTGDYHPGLKRWIEKEVAALDQETCWNGTVGGAKLYHLDQWDCPEAQIIHRRAEELFKRVMDSDQAVVDLSWCTYYRKGDYCMPHSHMRCTASLVYFLDLGDQDELETSAGRFTFTDPRIRMCCRQKEGYMTTPCAPLHEEGTLIMFPGQVVHYVTPYAGERPRMTLSWNISKEAIPGSPFDDAV